MDIFEQTKKDLQQFVDKAEVFIEQQETKLNAVRKPPTHQKKCDVVEELKQQITEKEQEINDICQNYDFQINDFSREVYRLQKREKILEQQLALTEKALELACERINCATEDCRLCPLDNKCKGLLYEDTKKLYFDYFKEQAKEMMKSE